MATSTPTKTPAKGKGKGKTPKTPATPSVTIAPAPAYSIPDLLRDDIYNQMNLSNLGVKMKTKHNFVVTLDSETSEVIFTYGKIECQTYFKISNTTAWRKDLEIGTFFEFADGKHDYSSVLCNTSDFNNIYSSIKAKGFRIVVTPSIKSAFIDTAFPGDSVIPSNSAGHVSHVTPVVVPWSTSILSDLAAGNMPGTSPPAPKAAAPSSSSSSSSSSASSSALPGPVAGAGPPPPPTPVLVTNPTNPAPTVTSSNGGLAVPTVITTVPVNPNVSRLNQLANKPQAALTLAEIEEYNSALADEPIEVQRAEVKVPTFSASKSNSRYVENKFNPKNLDPNNPLALVEKLADKIRFKDLGVLKPYELGSFQHLSKEDLKKIYAAQSATTKRVYDEFYGLNKYKQLKFERYGIRTLKDDPMTIIEPQPPANEVAPNEVLYKAIDAGNNNKKYVLSLFSR